MSAIDTIMPSAVLGVKSKMVKLRSEADAANDRADGLTRQLNETSEKLHQTEEERNALQR